MLTEVKKLAMKKGLNMTQLSESLSVSRMQLYRVIRNPSKYQNYYNDLLSILGVDTVYNTTLELENRIAYLEDQLVRAKGKLSKLKRYN